MEKHKMYKAAPASYHKHICVWFCNKKTSVSAAKLHLNYRKNTIVSDICLVFIKNKLQLLCELIKSTSVGLFCFEVYFYIKHN